MSAPEVVALILGIACLGLIFIQGTLLWDLNQKYQRIMEDFREHIKWTRQRP